MFEELIKMIVNGVVGNFSYDRLKSIVRTSSEESSVNFNNKENAKYQEPTNPAKEKTRTVPENIEFGTTLLRTPTLEEIGIPAPFAYLPYITCHVNAGEWVDRDDPLVTYTLVDYAVSKKLPLPFRLIFGDRTLTQSFQLESPIAGFITDIREVKCREPSFGRHLPLGPGKIGKEAVLPTLLVPNEEPAWTHYHLSTFSSQICQALSNNWERNQHNMGGTVGYRRARVSEAISKELFWSYSESAKEKLEYAIAWAKSNPCSKRDDEMRWPLCDYVDYKNSYNSNLHECIESYRAQDYSLRDKLVHLTRLNSNEH